MALPVTIPNTFANATAAIPLSQLDANFNTLSNAVNGLNSGSETLANLKATTANVVTLTVTGNATIGDASTDTVTLNSTLTANTAVIFSAGTSAAPSITFTSDTNTGIFSPAADTIAFAEGGAEAMRIDSSGNLRVGTTSSLSVADKLTVVGGNFAVQRSSGITTFMGDNTTDGYAGTATNHAFALLTNSTERARIDTSGNLLVGITSARANAGDVQVSKGISFPATQSAQSDANTLDDYEEGTWTPTLPNGGTLTVTSARYVKIGQQVTVSFYVLSVAPTNDSNDFRIGGLPFASGGYSDFYLGGSFGYVGDSSLSGWLPITGVNLTYIYFHIQGAVPVRTNAQYLTAASGSVDALIITITYFAAT